MPTAFQSARSNPPSVMPWAPALRSSSPRRVSPSSIQRFRPRSTSTRLIPTATSTMCPTPVEPPASATYSSMRTPWGERTPFSSWVNRANAALHVRTPVHPPPHHPRQSAARPRRLVEADLPARQSILLPLLSFGRLVDPQQRPRRRLRRHTLGHRVGPDRLCLGVLDSGRLPAVRVGVSCC